MRQLGATRRQVARWRGAMSWRGRVESALAGSGLRFNEWLVLEATCRLVSETADAVSQNQVATRVQLSRMSVTNAIRALEKRRFVSRGGPMSGPAWRVFVTREGVELLNEYAEAIESASARA
jgi:DNA-binding MarR family transcriptional regulator